MIRNQLSSLVFTPLFALIFIAPGFAQRLINVATDATDNLSIDNKEPSIAVNPRNPKEIVITTFAEPWSLPFQMNAPIWRSTDGGETWKKLSIIPPPSQRSGPGDQFAIFDSGGQLLVVVMDKAGHGLSCSSYIYRQQGGPEDNLVKGVPYGDDQPMLAIDRSNGPCANRIYSSWMDINRFSPVELSKAMVSYTTDRGTSVTTVKPVDTLEQENRTTRVAVAPNSKVYFLYKVSGPMGPEPFQISRFRVSRSDDCGVTWNALGENGVSVHGSQQVSSWLTMSFGNPAKGLVSKALSSDGWIAIGPNDGDIYVAYVNKDQSGFGQIYLARSTDEGKTWISRRVTDGHHHSGFPEIAVTENGTVGMLYVDYDDSQARTIFRHHFVLSYDHGVKFADTILQSMDPSEISTQAGIIWGDYEGLTAQGNNFYGAFTGRSLPGARTKPQLDPIFFTASALPPSAKTSSLNPAVTKSNTSP